MILSTTEFIPDRQTDKIFPLWSTKISSDNGCHLFGSAMVGFPEKIGANGSFIGS